MAIGYLISPVIQVEDINGKPLVGGRIRVYVHGTTTPYITYKDFNGDMNPAEVILDNKGMCVLLADTSGLYDIYCEDRNYVEQWSRLNVTAGQSGGGATPSSYISTITSSDNSLVIIRTGSNVDIKINRDGQASALCAFSAVRSSDGQFEFVCTPVNSVGDDIKVYGDNIIARRKWYHYDATVQLSWNGNATNATQDIAITGPANSEHVSFDLSYAHDESLDISGVHEIQTDGSAFAFAVQGMPTGMTAQVTNASIHVIEMGAGGSGSGGGGLESVDHDGTLTGDGTLISPLGVNPDVVQGKLVEGEGVHIDGDTNTISVNIGGGLVVNCDNEIEINTDVVASQEDLSGKADKVEGATDGNLAALDSEGNLTDSGIDPSTLATQTDITNINQVPPSDPADVNKVLTVDSNGEPVWLPSQGGGGGSQVQTDWDCVDSNLPQYLRNKPQNLVQDAAYVHTDNNFTTTLKDKLEGIEAGAQANVKPDWNAAAGADDEILNKPNLATVATSGSYTDLSNTPTIPSGNQLLPSATSADEGKVLTVDSNGDPEWGAGPTFTQEQANWTESDNTLPSFVRNKPVVKSLVAGTGISITEANGQIVISLA